MGFSFGTVVTLGLVLLVVFVLWLRGFISKHLVKLEQGHALLISRAGADSTVRVSFTGGIVWPLFEKAEMMDISVRTIDIDRRGKDGLICKDNIRADISVSFYIKVNREEADVLEVARNVGCDRAADVDTMQKLFAAKFSEALKTAGKRMDFEELYTKREEFRDAIKEVIGRDLNGYHLEDVAIDHLEQTPLEDLDPNNMLDAEGITKITGRTGAQLIATNKLRANAEKEVEKENTEKNDVLSELKRQQQNKAAEMQRLVATKLAEEQSATRISQAEQMALAEEARIRAQEKIDIDNVNRLREVQVAEKNKERVIAVEGERVEKDRMLEQIIRERETEIRRIEKERDLEEERKKIQDVIAERIAVEKNVAQEEERINELRLLEKARREKEARVIAASAEAEESSIKLVKAAEAEEMVARAKAKARLTMVEAELEAADRSAQAKIRLAEGTQAEKAAEGLAEARVKEAMALALEKEGMAKARVLEAQAPAEEKMGMAKVAVYQAESNSEASSTKAKMLAEAEGTREKMIAEAEGTRQKMEAEASGIAKKAEAMKALDEASRGHEEYRLRLESDRLVAMEQLHVQREIAESQSKILAEAFRSAKIDIVGGDGAFIDKIFQAASFGKSLDHFGKGGNAAAHVVQEYTNGARSLAGDIKDVLTGVRSEDIRNLTLANLLSKMADEAGGADKIKLKKVADAVATMGIADLQLGDGGKA
jgi:uncharacterized membrane protein YqiK